MEDLKQTLAERFYTYLCYDPKSNLKFHDPSQKNKDYWKRVRKDANRLAEIAIEDFKKL